jgi:hypothetical protein
MKEGPPQPAEQESFWHLDEELGSLELMERPSGPEIYTVRLKAQTNTGPYYANRELYPLSRDGTQHDVSGRAYILVPDFSLTVGLFPQPKSSGAIGEVTSSTWEGMRHHDIAALRALYYQEDQAIGLWEVVDWGRLDTFAHGKLWTLFESWLFKRFPAARQIYTDDAEPRETEEENRELLRSLGYEHVAGTHCIFQKEVIRR